MAERLWMLRSSTPRVQRIYPEVYDLFRDFKYNPIDDARFALLEGTEDALTDDEREIILKGCLINYYRG